MGGLGEADGSGDAALGGGLMLGRGSWFPARAGADEDFKYF